MSSEKIIFSNIVEGQMFREKYISLINVKMNSSTCSILSKELIE
jgi:hypothetical protein